MSYSPLRTALLLVDLQCGFAHPNHWGTHRSTPILETNVAKLLAAFRSLSPPPLIIHLQHRSKHPSSVLHPSHDEGRSKEFANYAQPRLGELIMTKDVNSGFISTDLEAILRRTNTQKLVVAGLTTCHCVSTTVRMASNLRVVREHPYGGPIQDTNEQRGEIILVSDATGMWEVTDKDGKLLMDAETAHEVHLASLRGEFCDVRTTIEVLHGLKA